MCARFLLPNRDHFYDKPCGGHTATYGVQSLIFMNLNVVGV